MALPQGVMMGLLDPTNDPGTMGLLSLGLGLLGSKGSFGSALSQAGPQALQAMQQVKDRQRLAEQDKQQQAMRALQMQQAQMQLAEAQRAQAEREKMAGLAQQFARTPQQMALANGQGPTVGNAAAIPKTAAGFDYGGYADALAGIDPIKALSLKQAMQKDDTPIALAEGGMLVRKDGRMVASNPKSPDLTSDVRNYQFAVSQGFNGTFDQWNKDTKRAGATNIGMPKIEVKMGESVAGQIGPMAKDSRIQAQGAVGMFDSADRIQRALDSGKASAGPFTTQIQTVKQLVQKVAGGNDEGIRQTRQVIKGLAQMSVEARKELQGQGQVTESEAAAVAKAESGDINDLTTGELQDLVTLTKRAAHMRAVNHQSLLDSMSSQDATKGSVPFYKLQGLDRLLKHNPQMPQIGGSSAVDAALQKYGNK